MLACLRVVSAASLHTSETKHFGTVAYMSFVLFLMNWFLIFTMALIIFKVKKIKAWKKLGEFAQEHMAEVSLTRVQMDAR